MSLLNGQRQKPRPSSTTCFDGQCEPPSNVGHFDDDDPRSIRKYLVLLQDCLAIKFVPFRQQPHQFSFPFNNNEHINNPNGSNTCYNGFDNTIRRSSSRCSNRHSNYCSNGNGEDHQLQDYKSKSNSLYSSRKIEPNLMTANLAIASAAGSSTSNGLLTDQSLSSAIEVDHSLNGLHLYKSFREANLKCYWNSTLYEAFQHLEYKGHIVPSTLLIWAIPHYLATLRTAWSRQILRSPPGFRIEFIGEIEELLADPIQQSQFAPLSDSLCWAILEVTSVGQEAFVDSILSALNTAFPTMVLPPKEFIYATLEKLIKERKVYQTSHGYFVVTPDTLRYMVSSGNSMPASPVADCNNHYSTIGHASCSSPMPLEALLSPSPLPQSHRPSSRQEEHRHDPEQMSFSRNSWDSKGSAKNSPTSNGCSSPDEIESNPHQQKQGQQLRRHNSLKIIRQRDSSLDRRANQDFIKDKTRSMSFRLYKSKSTPNTLKGDQNKGSVSKMENLSQQMENLLKKEGKDSRGKSSNENTKSGKVSFLSRLFKRSSLKKAANKSGALAKPSASTSTQTPPTYNLITSELEFGKEEELADVENNSTSLIIPKINEKAIQHFELPNDLLLTEDLIQNQPVPSFNSRSNSLPRRPGSRLSDTTFDENHLYSTPTNGCGSSISTNCQVSGQMNESKNRSRFQSGTSSRCSTLSRGTSLGYGSQGPTSLSLGFMSNSQSPSPSLSPSGIYSTLNHQHQRQAVGSSSNASTPIKISQPGSNVFPSRAAARNYSYGSYRNYYDYYRRRYPPYGSTTMQQPASSSLKSNNESKLLNNENDNKTIKNQQQGESNKTTQPQECSLNQSNNNENIISSSTSRISPFKTTTTTTVTQNVKSTTNMELEFSLPLGKSTRMSTRNVQPVTMKNNSNENCNKMNVNVSCSPQKSTAKFIIGQPVTSNRSCADQNNKTTTTEVQTIINHNGTIETQFDCSDPNITQVTNCNAVDEVKKVSSNKYGSSSLTTNEYSTTNGNTAKKEKVTTVGDANISDQLVSEEKLIAKAGPTNGNGFIKKRPVPPVLLKYGTENGLGLGYGSKPAKVTDFKCAETDFM